MLFSGDQFYESVDISDNQIGFTVKSIKELNETLEPPIDIAFNDISNSEVDLSLINLSDSLLYGICIDKKVIELSNVC